MRDIGIVVEVAILGDFVANLTLLTARNSGYLLITMIIVITTTIFIALSSTGASHMREFTVV